MDTRTDGRATTPRAVDLRRPRAPEVLVLPCETYDFLLSLHVALSPTEQEVPEFDIGRDWVLDARARCDARDPQALRVLSRLMGDGDDQSLHASLISLVYQCPEPRDVAHFLDWLDALPAVQLAEVLLDQDGLAPEWTGLLAAALGAGDTPEATTPEGRAAAQERLLRLFSEEVRPTIANVLADMEVTRAALVGGLRVWHEAVFAEEAPRIAALVRREAEAMDRLRAASPPEAFIEHAMRGVQVQRPAGLRRIVFAPSYFCRPAVFYHFWRGTLTFCAPLEYTGPEVDAHRRDPSLPDEEMLRFFEALGDDTRLRILRHLSEREMYLTELSEHLHLTKATTKHHMIRLRAAGLVTLYDRDRLTYYALRPDVARRATVLLDGYLGRR